MTRSIETRAEEVRRERRMKPGAVTQYGIKLGVNEELLDRKTFTYRWVNDKGNRVRALEAQDWDRAPEQAAMSSDGLGTVQEKIVGTDESGRPMNAVLMRKYRDWHERDQKLKRAPLDEIDKQIRRGEIHRRSNEPALAEGIAYTPEGGNSIHR